jgi:hypothetical protein
VKKDELKQNYGSPDSQQFVLARWLKFIKYDLNACTCLGGGKLQGPGGQFSNRMQASQVGVSREPEGCWKETASGAKQAMTASLKPTLRAWFSTSSPKGTWPDSLPKMSFTLRPLITPF